MTRKRGTAAPPSTGPQPGQRFSATPGPPCPAISADFSLKFWSLGSTRVLARGKVGKVLWSRGGVVRSSWGGGGGGGSDSHRTPRDSSRICGFDGQQAVGEHGQGHWGATWHYRGGVGGSFLNRTLTLGLDSFSRNSSGFRGRLVIDVSQGQSRLWRPSWGPPRNTVS